MGRFRGTNVKALSLLAKLGITIPHENSDLLLSI